MYKLRIKGNRNACIADLNLTFTMSRPEKIIEDSEFESSEDLKKLIDKDFFDVEHINVTKIDTKNNIKKVFAKDAKEVDNSIKTTSVKTEDDKTRITVENKEHPDEHEIVVAEKVLGKEQSPNENIVNADDASQEKIEEKPEIEAEEAKTEEIKEEPKEEPEIPWTLPSEKEPEPEPEPEPVVEEVQEEVPKKKAKRKIKIGLKK
jgi:hypothetical protein